MLENTPFEIKVEIIRRLPVKSLIQFRSVSKAWKSLIDSSDFIAHYSAQQTHPQHLLISDALSHVTYVLIADDDTFPQVSVSLTPPRLLNWCADYTNIGCSHGLLCLYGDFREGRGGHKGLTGMAVLWNLSIRKAVAVIVPNVGDGMYFTVVGFGVCRETTDPKIVKITYISRESDMESISCIPWQVEVFTLSTGAWRSPYGNLPRKSIQFGLKQVAVDGFLYWLATDTITMGSGYRSYGLVISFNMTTEEFREVSLPGSLGLAQHTNHILHIYNLRNSLVVLDHDLDANNPLYVAWMMEDGVPKSFTKLFTINVNTPNAYVRGFRKSGAPIVESVEDDWGQLVVYEPNSKRSGSFWIDRLEYTIRVYPYMETLLLLDQPNLMVYNDISMYRVKNKRLLKHTS